MLIRRTTNLLLILGSLAAFAAGPAAQDDEDFQSWNDVQLTVPMSKLVDFQTKVTMRFGKNVTRLNDGRWQFGFVFKPTKSFSITPFFWLIRARNASGQFRTEHRLNLSASYRFPIKSFGLIHRSTLERRLRQPANTWRYRPSLTFEKEIPESILHAAKFFVGDEVFYDSSTRKFSRNRFSIGINKTLTKQLSVDIYYMRQNDGFAHPGDLNAIWTAWRIKL
ncbi:MAG TPA: DUF2490 domain-containing protein [Pyrinomonadaceae bacterium]|jgi:hypothetical protein|nr:DUF2490 domain-containing protein [Pyrinomonadaceae bacterium]